MVLTRTVVGRPAQAAGQFRPLTGPFVAVVDTTSIASAGTFANGRLTATTQAHTTQVDGFQEGLREHTAPFLSVFPGFDRSTDTLEFLIDLLTTPSAATGLGVFVGVVDSLTVDVNRQGVLIGWSQATSTTDRAERLNAAGVVAAVVPSEEISHVWGTIEFGDDGTDSATNQLIGAYTDDGRRFAGTATVPITLRGTPDDWHVVAGLYHRGTTDLGVQAVLADVYARVERKVPRPF